MDQLNNLETILLRFAARFRIPPETSRRSADPAEINLLVERLMAEGFYSEEFA